MYKKLDAYLEEIDHYLAVEAEEVHGEVTEESIEMTIEGYGSPKEVAEKYLEGFHIISPAYRKYLFRYTWILFMVHYGLTCLAFVVGTSVHMFPPLFAIPRMENIFDLLAQMPMTLVYDFGLVGLGLFFVTQLKENVKLPWPDFLKKGLKKRYTPETPKWYFLALMVFGFSAVIYVYSLFGTLFFRSLNPDNVEPLFTVPASTLYSLVVIGVFGVEIICYIIRFFHNTFWVDLVKNMILLTVLWFIYNFPIENAFLEFPYFDLETAANWLLIGICVVISLESISIIYKLVRNSLSVKTAAQ
jgi:hypothetical protein